MKISVSVPTVSTPILSEMRISVSDTKLSIPILQELVISLSDMMLTLVRAISPMQLLSEIYHMLPHPIPWFSGR